MSKAIRIHQVGGPEVLSWEEVDIAPPSPTDVVIRQTAVGLNFIDVYQRTGLYPVSLPATLGLEGAGVVEAVGAAVNDFRPGDRVAYAHGPRGAYAEKRVFPADHLVKIPDGISDIQAAAMMLKGLTAHYLIRRIHPVQPGETILIHAAAGGVGLLVCQWAKHLGATVIGTVGSEEKAALAKAHGCDHPILYDREDFVARVHEITGGQGVPVVFDSVGQRTFLSSLDCLRPRGLMVSFGQSSGAVAPFSPGLLQTKGSLFLTRPTLGHYIATREELVTNAAELFDVVVKKAVTIEVNHTYPLAEAARAHRDLEARLTTGSTVLIP